ncbi:MAG: alpha-D-glucose phosphate-specific phosphoglucomutase, partial [Alphaproteobacteria bacterium]
AAANKVAEVVVGQHGLLSTPAASHLIRLNQADGGFILSASHNPAGIDKDFGVKFNTATGSPAPENLSDLVFQETLTLKAYMIADVDDIPLDIIDDYQLGPMSIRVVDPVADYQKLMENLFDFDAIAHMFSQGFSICFDAMHAVTGPYAKAIFEDRLGAASGSVMNATPLPDFGGGHPDPNPTWAASLMQLMASDQAPDLGAASDGDGDRNMVVSKNMYVAPSDSMAIIAANAHLVPAYSEGLKGIARSMPTSAACDRVAASLGIDLFETPTGWKFFGNLLDAGRVTICGEESAGMGSNHIREKDGLWSVLMWLNILAKRHASVEEVVTDHWGNFGRDYFCRMDFENVPSSDANDLVTRLQSLLSELKGKKFDGLTVQKADSFAYQDPVDGSTSANQGIRIWFDNQMRAVVRLSGTGTQAATIRVYLEKYEDRPSALQQDPKQVLKPLCAAVIALGNFEQILGRTEPDVIS